MLNVLIAIMGIGFFLMLIEWLTVQRNIPRTHSRKIVHTGTAFLVILISMVFGWKLFVPLGFLFFIVLTLSRLFRPLESLNDRSNESIGELLFPLGVAITALISQSEIDFTIAILILGISDTLAFYIGRKIKSWRLVYKKTVAGSLAFFISAFMITLLLGNGVLALTVAAVTTLAELIGTKGIDNISVPILAAFIIVIF